MPTKTELKADIEAKLNRLNEIVQEAEEILPRISQMETDSQAKQQEVAKWHSVAQPQQEKIADWHDQADEQQQAIARSKEYIDGQEMAITDFAQEIATHKNEIAKQRQSSKEYDKKLKEYEAEMESFKEAARETLQLTGAAGLSEAFSTEYDKKAKPMKQLQQVFWVLSAAGFVVAATGISFWLLLEAETVNFAVAFFRLAVASLLISGAWFCAGQYVKNKNIMEDYGYKSVLAKSLVAFLEQLPKAARKGYLAMALLEIHQDPLRKRHDKANLKERLKQFLDSYRDEKPDGDEGL